VTDGVEEVLRKAVSIQDGVEVHTAKVLYESGHESGAVFAVIAEEREGLGESLESGLEEESDFELAEIDNHLIEPTQSVLVVEDWAAYDLLLRLFVIGREESRCQQIGYVRLKDNTGLKSRTH
jgi:hypothetical protein